MIRRLLTVAFVLAAVGNSLAGISPQSEGDGACGAACCRAAQRKAPKTLLSKHCCMTDCNQPAENQGSSTEGLLRNQRDSKSGDSAAVTIHADWPDQTSSFLRSSTRTVVQSKRVYLMTGTLLI